MNFYGKFRYLINGIKNKFQFNFTKVTNRTDHLTQQNGSGKVLKDVLG